MSNEDIASTWKTFCINHEHMFKRFQLRGILEPIVEPIAEPIAELMVD